MLKDIKFQYNGVYVDYSYTYDCENYGCDEEGICRCGSIHNESVESVDVSLIVKKIYDEFFEEGKAANRNNTINEVLYGIGKDIDIYTIDRIIRSYKIWESDNWDIEVEGGYYGQEVNDVRIKESIADKIEEELMTVFSLPSLKEKIEYLLKVEYGKILPEITDSNYESITIDKDDIIFGTEKHLDKVMKKDLDFYSDKNYNGIRGIVKKSGDKWRVIDGYHRIFSTKFPRVKVLVATK
jgi:hypothetical protein